MTPEQHERHKARCRAYYLANRQHLLAVQAEHRKANPEERKAHDATYRARNADKVLAAKEAYRVANLEKVKASKKRWRLENKEKMQEARATWERNNQAKKRVYRENRRAREKNAIGAVSPEIVARLMLEQAGKCVVCSIDLIRYEIDHIIPLVLGGTHEDHNLQLLCITCNRSKGRKRMEQFLRERAA